MPLPSFLSRKGKHSSDGAAAGSGTSSRDSTELEKAHPDAEHTPIRLFRLRIVVMGLLVSMGGLIFGFDTGQISGFLEMDDFLHRFADEGTKQAPAFSNSREGTIVALLSIGTLIGSLIAGPIADYTGRKICIVILNIIFCVGVVIQIATQDAWYQIAIGRLIAGWGVGGLSVLTPMYQSETAPRQIRGGLVSMYQLFITLGIFLAYCINYGTESIQSPASWRITMGVGFIFPVIMAVGIMFLRESPRWDYRKGNIDRARATVALSYGVPESHIEVRREMREIKEKFDAETAGGAKHPWYEIFTGPRMAYRTILGVVLQALQQLTGANFFFYYGTTIFASVGLSNSYVTSMILGGINFAFTFPGLYVVDHFGRRNSLIIGGLCMFACFMVFASVGHFVLQAAGGDSETAGNVMIVFACLFIVSYATTWGPIIWALVAEIYPSRYRARSMGIATSSNWTLNFLISFFTPYITSAIDYQYGYVFAACCFAGAVVVYFFVCESQGRTLEEIDTMYIMHVPPWSSRSWKAPEGEELGETDRAYLTKGARGIRKSRQDDGVAESEPQQAENADPYGQQASRP